MARAFLAIVSLVAGAPLAVAGAFSMVRGKDRVVD